MYNLYKFIYDNINNNKGEYKISLLTTRLNNMDVVIILGYKFFINKRELFSSLQNEGFNISSIKINKMEIITLFIEKEKLSNKVKKYQK